jgi:hypothetical protein
VLALHRARGPGVHRFVQAMVQIGELAAVVWMS